MTVRELIAQLQTMPQDAQVVRADSDRSGREIKAVREIDREILDYETRMQYFRELSDYHDGFMYERVVMVGAG